MFTAIRHYFQRIDRWTAALCLLSSVLSIVLLMSIHQSYPDYVGKRTVLMQIGATGLGVVAMIVLSLVDYTIFTRFWYIHYPLCILFVCLTFVFGVGRAGADDKAWLLIFGVSVQPSEFLKLSFILTFAAQVEHIKDSVNTFFGLLRLCFFGLLPCALVVLQGDDGSAMVFLLIFVCMIFAAGISYKWIALAGGLAAVAVPLIWKFVMNNDQKLRFLVLFDDSISPEVVYQQNAGLKAMSYGGMWGTGLFNGTHKYIPEMHNDMIFSFIGNALGFVGCCAVLLVLGTISVRILLAARKSEENVQGKIVCAGVFGMFAFQTIINVGMNLKVLPVVGITLPLFSSGGSSVLMTYIAVGIIMNVYSQSHLKTLY